MPQRLGLDEVEALASQALVAAGGQAAQAEPVARSIRAAERDGMRSRGREWTKHGGHAARFLFATVSRPSRTAALVTATR